MIHSKENSIRHSRDRLCRCCDLLSTFFFILFSSFCVCVCVYALYAVCIRFDGSWQLLHGNCAVSLSFYTLRFLDFCVSVCFSDAAYVWNWRRKMSSFVLCERVDDFGGIKQENENEKKPTQRWNEMKNSLLGYWMEIIKWTKRMRQTNKQQQQKTNKHCDEKEAAFQINSHSFIIIRTHEQAQTRTCRVRESTVRGLLMAAKSDKCCSRRLLMSYLWMPSHCVYISFLVPIVREYSFILPLFFSFSSSSCFDFSGTILC